MQCPCTDSPEPTTRVDTWGCPEQAWAGNSQGAVFRWMGVQ
jgi:hypothetical protein